jgi:hypothetical protein
MDWINLAQDRDQRRAIVNTVMDRWFPLNSDKFFSILPTGGLGSRDDIHGAS